MKCENVEIYFKLTFYQRKALNKKGYCHVLLENIPLEVFCNITSNKALIERFKAYKFRHGLKLVKVG